MSDGTETDLGTSSNLPIRIEIPGYRLRRQIGEDAIGLWFDAEQESLGRKLTIKVLKPQYENHPGARKEFLAEMDRLAGLNHGNLIQVIDMHREGALYVVTERMVHTVAELLRDRKPLGEETSLRIAQGLARALRYLDGQGFAHKNVTPSLLALRDDGGCRLVTFRNVIPKEEQAGLQGRLAQDARYVAPEQLAGAAKPGATTPCYHTGALLFHLLAGRPPHGPGDAQEVARAHLNEAFPSLKRHQPFLNAGIYRLVEACTRRDPAARPTLEQLENAIDSLLKGKDFDEEGKPRDRKLAAPRPRRRRRRR